MASCQILTKVRPGVKLLLLFFHTYTHIYHGQVCVNAHVLLRDTAHVYLCILSNLDVKSSM